MDGEKVMSHGNAPMYRVMLFKPIGQYPEGRLFTPNSFFSADKDLVFSVTYGGSWQALDEDVAYSEFDWASPEELRLLGSILLCEKRDEALVRFYPVIYYSPRIDAKNLDLSNHDTAIAVKELLLETSHNPRSQSGDNILSECVIGDYPLVSQDRYNLDRLSLFWNRISVDNYVLMRGIYSLIKSEMLACHTEFWEEAIIVSYIALDASFHLVRRELTSNGTEDPTANDAARWLYDHFDKPFGLPEPTIEKYFQEFYEDRIKTLHPANRFGESPYSPIMHDDFSHLRRALREIFAYLVSGEHGPDYYEKVKRYSNHTVTNSKNA